MPNSWCEFQHFPITPGNQRGVISKRRSLGAGNPASLGAPPRQVGFVWVCFGFVFSSREGWFIFVSPCDKGGCIDFVLLRIGFVLHKK